MIMRLQLVGGMKLGLPEIVYNASTPVLRQLASVHRLFYPCLSKVPCRDEIAAPAVPNRRVTAAPLISSP